MYRHHPQWQQARQIVQDGGVGELRTINSVFSYFNRDPDNVRNHPKLQGMDIPRTGRVGRIGTLVTKTLVIAGEGGFFTTPEGARGAMLRAYDKGTGAEVGSVFMPAPQTGTPMTYVVDGTQYLVIAIGGSGHEAELVAFRLPS